MDETSVICFNCLELSDVMDTHGISISDYNSPPIKIVGINERQEYTCTKCNECLSAYDLYFESVSDFNEFVEQVITSLGQTLSFKIHRCSHCNEGSDIEAYIYSFNRDVEDEDDEHPSTGMDIWDFLSEENIPQDYVDRVISELRCLNCGYGEPYHPKHNPDSHNFEYSDRIYSEDEINEFWGYDQEFINFASRYGVNFDEKELSDFREHLYVNPAVAPRSITAGKIYDVLKMSFEDDEFYLLKSSTIIYRGRSRNKDMSSYNSDGLWSPPAGVASHGRYNAVGVPILYCCDTIDAIPYELHPTHEQAIDIASIDVKNNMKLLDIDEVFKGFEKFYASQNEETSTIKKAYLFTNFIGGCCLDIGFQGVKYEGVANWNGKYTNYALFNYVKDTDLEILEVKPKSFQIAYL
ncbi:RES family NAD+ phosphorylase [Cohnella sp. LGH]|uniref:RES family NAD+ phosphorylase n=1 Tax=Cohnella sp. LGH TaxID=1619153 RepID=UPI001AD9BABD|nr:RES family NAD+ phosphorylase [Cohnella sp. LGH]QTH41662.1 RES family NAD+ phosphorylase [Cohnella sp. LGH]